MAISVDWRPLVAGRIQALLRARGFSPQDLVEKVSLPPRQIKAILDARPVPVRSRDLDVIAAFLGIATYVLFLPVDTPIEIVPFEKVEKGGSGHS